MASLSPRNTPSTPKIPEENHDVFLNFRGEDTRYSFTSHLNAALTRLDIKTYMDYEIQRGDGISTTLIRAIEEAKISIIIFSETFASSKWCLDELVKIVECQSKMGQIIVPIFYHVDPSHVRNQKGSYGEAFAVHEKIFKDDMNKVLRWKESLATAASLTGWDCAVYRMESELVEKIAENVLQKLDSAHGGDLNSQIRTQRQMALTKYNNYLITSGLNDLKDIINTLQQLIHLKMGKVLKTNKESDWDDLSKTYELILHLKEEMYKRTFEKNDCDDLDATRSDFSQFLKEKDSRIKGINPNMI